MELGKVICVPDPADAGARDDAMAAAVSAELTDAPELPGIDAGLIQADAPHAGRIFVQGTLDGRPFDHVAGVGWRLITLDGAEHTRGTHGTDTAGAQDLLTNLRDLLSLTTATRGTHQ